MNVTFYVESIVNKMRSISHWEVQEIADVEARYRAEAGSEKLNELYLCVDDAVGRLRGRTFRWMKYDYKKEMDNMQNIPLLYKFEFMLSERRTLNKIDALEEAMNTFIVEYALSKYYSLVSQTELSNKHSLLAVDSANALDELLYAKRPPIV